MLRSFTAPSQLEHPLNLREALETEERPECPAAKITAAWPKFVPRPNPGGQQSAQGSTPEPQPGPSNVAPGNIQHSLQGKAQPRSMSETQHGKYSERHGLFCPNSLSEEIPEEIREELTRNANASLAYQTWRAVKSVKRRIEQCERETGCSLSLPWSRVKLEIFSGWCLRRGLRDKTVDNYISKVILIS